MFKTTIAACVLLLAGCGVNTNKSSAPPADRDSGYNFYFLNKSKHWKSLIDYAKFPDLRICLNTEKLGEISGEMLQEKSSDIVKAVNQWFQPLKKFATVPVPKDIVVTQECTSDQTFTVNINTPSGLEAACDHGNRACASFHQQRIELSHRSSFVTTLHEVGHLFGLGDTYWERGGGFPDTASDGECLKGFNENDTIMCGSDDKLGPADVQAIRRLYCAQWTDEKCPISADFNRASFGAMVECQDEKGSLSIFDHDYSLFSIYSWQAQKRHGGRYQFVKSTFEDNALIAAFVSYPVITPEHQEDYQSKKYQVSIDLISNKIAHKYTNKRGKIESAEFGLSNDCMRSPGFFRYLKGVSGQ